MLLRFKLRQFACALAFFAAMGIPRAYALPVLLCQLEQGGALRVLETRPGSDPYDFKAIDLDKRFRFRAVVIGNADSIEYVKLYAYYRKDAISVLMHQVTYRAPRLPDAGATIGLTGLVTLYAPPLGRQLQYSCDLAGT